MENKCSDSESFITQDDINNYESGCNECISRMGRVALTVSTIDNVCSASDCTCTRNTRFLRSITTLNFTTGSCLSSLEKESFTVKPVILPSISLVFYNIRCVTFDVNSKQFIAFNYIFKKDKFNLIAKNTNMPFENLHSNVYRKNGSFVFKQIQIYGIILKCYIY